MKYSINLIYILALLVSVVSCSRNGSEYGVVPPNGNGGPQVYEPEMPVTPPTPTGIAMPPPPKVYPKPGERILEYLVSVDISKDSQSWLPNETEKMATWFENLAKLGFQFRIAFINSAQDKSGSYDFKIIDRIVINQTEDIRERIKSVLENPKNLKEGNAKQFMVLDMAANYIGNSWFFHLEHDLVYLSLCTKSEYQDPSSPDPSDYAPILERSLRRGGKKSQTIHFASSLFAGSISWAKNVINTLHSLDSHSFGWGVESLYAPSVSTIFGPDAVPK